VPSVSTRSRHTIHRQTNGQRCRRFQSRALPQPLFLGPDGRIYVMGGYGNDAYLNSAEVYDPSTDVWSPIASMQSIRFAPAAALGPDGRIYAIGGYDGTGDTVTVEAYDPNTDTWTFVTPMNYSRSAFAAAAGIDGTIYAIGGEATYPPLGIVEAYTLY